MDPLSTAASGIAVVSLALQLVKSIDDIRTCIRSVKEAPKELIRLNGRLERLGALLKDADHLVQLQAAMPKHLLPPSASISNCLRSCEEGLLPLRTKIENYLKGQARNKSATARLRGNISLSFKMKDIISLEARIQEEIADLTTAVQLASAIHQFSIPSYGLAQLNAKKTQQQQMTAVIQAQNDEFKPRSNIVKATRKSLQVSAVWRSLGLSTQAITYHFRNDASSTAEEDSSISEEYEYLWNVPFLRRVVRWSQTTSYGSLTTSLSVYPVVESFDSSLYDLLDSGDLQDFRRLISSGELHPFTRDSCGRSLLHKAAQHGRLDVCRILSTCGVQVSCDLRDRSPYYELVIGNLSLPDPFETSIDLLRYFLLDLPRIDDFESDVWSFTGLAFSAVEVIEWIWRFSVTIPTNEEKIRLQMLLIHDIVKMISTEWWREQGFLALETVVKLVHPLLIAEIAGGQAGILEKFLDCVMKSDESLSGGDALFAMLKRLGLDHVEVISKELGNFDGDIHIHPWSDIGKKIFFDQKDDGEWTLHWEYVAIGEDFTALFISEFLSLTASAEIVDGWHWPFFDIDWSLGTHDECFKLGIKWDTRRNRRMLNHTRKELARSGHKRIRSRMPGSWTS